MGSGSRSGTLGWVGGWHCCTKDLHKLGTTRLTVVAEDKVSGREKKKEVDDDEEENHSQVSECAVALIERRTSASAAHIGKTRKASVQLLRKPPRCGGLGDGGVET